MGGLGRKPLQIVEIDIDYCQLTYGQAPCTAALGASGPRKCFNTFASCQDRDNIDLGTLTLSFSHNQAGLPADRIVYPCLEEVETAPTRITLGGSPDRRSGPLGTRSRVRVYLKDFADSDVVTDRYAAERRSGAAQEDGVGYEPLDRGTFFAKLRTRFPYYNARALRVRNGYVGDRPEDMPTRHYIMTEWHGPDAEGNVEIVAQDPFVLLGENQAVYPAPSNGAVTVEIDEQYTGALQLVPAGIGSEYGDGIIYVTIGDEILRCTRSGDTLTIVARGQFGTLPQIHAARSDVQLCAVFNNETVANVLQELLVSGADIPAEWIAVSDWQNEISTHLSDLRLTNTIARPTPVLELVSEIVNFGILLYPDETARTIRLQVIRPLQPDDSIPVVSDADVILKGSMQVKDLYDQRLSEVYFYHGYLNATQPFDQQSNYRNLRAAVDINATSDRQYRSHRVLRVYNPWLGENGNPFQALRAAVRILRRYLITPQEVTFLCDIKDRDTLRLGRVVNLRTRLLEDDTGAATPVQMIVVGVEERDSGNRLRITMQTNQFVSETGVIVPFSADANIPVPDYNAAFTPALGQINPQGSLGGGGSVQGNVDIFVIPGAIGTNELADGGVTSAKIASDAITSRELAPGAIGTNELADGGVTSAKIASDAITSRELAPGAIGTNELADGGVTSAKIASDAITSRELAPGAIGTNELADGGVTSAKIASDAITSRELAPGAIGTNELADGGVTSAKIASDAITSRELAPGAIGTNELADGGVTSAKIASDAITSRELAPGAIGTNELADGGVTSAKIASDAITSRELAPGAIGTNELADGGVTSAKIASDAITSRELVPGAIGTNELADGGVTSAKIASDAITIRNVTNDPGNPANPIISETYALSITGTEIVLTRTITR